MCEPAFLESGDGRAFFHQNLDRAPGIGVEVDSVGTPGVGQAHQEAGAVKSHSCSPLCRRARRPHQRHNQEGDMPFVLAHPRCQVPRRRGQILLQRSHLQVVTLGRGTPGGKGRTRRWARWTSAAAEILVLSFSLPEPTQYPGPGPWQPCMATEWRRRCSQGCRGRLSSTGHGHPSCLGEGVARVGALTGSSGVQPDKVRLSQGRQPMACSGLQA